MPHYDLITKALHFLGESSGKNRPDFSALAAHLEMPPEEFRQVFSEWTETSPIENPAQYLSLSHTKEALRRGEPALNSSTQQSDFKLNAASPELIKTQGEGMTIMARISDSPFGNCLIGETERGIFWLSFFDEADREKSIQEMHAEWPRATVTWDHDCAEKFAAQFSLGKPPFKLFVRGTPFQLRVWNALLQIPPGALVSYGVLAAAAGNPNAARATGSAVGANAISLLIPCHRVIRDTGISGHYRWGALRKRAILAWENARFFQEGKIS